MKLTITQLLLAGASLSGLTEALPHRDSPQQRLLNGLALPNKLGRNRPYTPGHRDKLDRYVDPEQEDLDPLPWRNGKGASVLGPINRDAPARAPTWCDLPALITAMLQTCAGVLPTLTPALRYDFTQTARSPFCLTPLMIICPRRNRKADGPDKLPSVSCQPAWNWLVST